VILFIRWKKGISSHRIELAGSRISSVVQGEDLGIS
jgi:hypothetical protein